MFGCRESYRKNRLLAQGKYCLYLLLLLIFFISFTQKNSQNTLFDPIFDSFDPIFITFKPHFHDRKLKKRVFYPSHPCHRHRNKSGK